MCQTDVNAPCARARLRKSMNFHDQESGRTTKRYTEATTPDARVELSTATRHDYDGGRPTECCPDTTAPAAGVKIQGKEKTAPE